METGEDLAWCCWPWCKRCARDRPRFASFIRFALYCWRHSMRGIADYAQTIKIAPTGTWFDLGWTAPCSERRSGRELAAIACRTGPQRLRQKRFGELLLDNATLALAPLIVLLQVHSWVRNGARYDSHCWAFDLVLCRAAGRYAYRQSKTEDTLERHNRAMDSAVNGIAIVDARGQHTYANAAFAQMMVARMPNPLSGGRGKRFTRRKTIGIVEKEIRESLRKNGKWYGPISIHRPDASVLPVEMSITGLPDGGVVCVSRDMTARRDAENARAQAEAKYRMLVEQVAQSATLRNWAFMENGCMLARRWRRCSFLGGRVADRFEGLDQARSSGRYPDGGGCGAGDQRGERFQAEYG